MIKKVFGNLWLWVIVAFLIVIIRWVWTGILANDFDYQRLTEEEERELLEKIESQKE